MKQVVLKPLHHRGQECIGIKTTEKYLHIAKERLVNIVSPLDDLWEKGELNI